MQQELKIKEQFVVDGKTFTSKEEAQQYLEELQNLQKEYSKDKYKDTVYYENWTTSGQEAESSTCHARWRTYDAALNAMANYSNSWRMRGTGWINKVTIHTNLDGSVEITNTKVYENK